MNKRYLIYAGLKYFGSIINTIVPKSKNWIYAEPHINGKSDCYDIYNCNGDNCLKTLDYFMRHYNHASRVFIETYDESRISFLNEYCKKNSNSNVKVEVIESIWGGKKEGVSILFFLKLIRNLIKKYRCSVWVSDTGWAHFFDRTKHQKLIDFNYASATKGAAVNSDIFNYDHFDYICDTSLMSATLSSATYLAKKRKYRITGFARNDSIGFTNKKQSIDKWLKEKNCYGKKIITYVPTFRETEIDNRDICVLGVEDNGELDPFLEENNAVLITKLHSHQTVFLANYTKNIIKYEPNYDFTIYDLLNYTDVLIGDYSSISQDFLLAHKPVIYLFTDIKQYNDDRGFQFDPFEDWCCGYIVYNWSQLKDAMQKGLNNEVCFVDGYKKIFRAWHKYDDFSSTRRQYQLLCSTLESK